MLQTFEMSTNQIEKATNICKSTLISYLNSWRFAHIRNTEKKKKILFPTGYTHKIRYYTITNKDLQDLRDYKEYRLRQGKWTIQQSL